MLRGFDIVSKSVAVNDTYQFWHGPTYEQKLLTNFVEH